VSLPRLLLGRVHRLVPSPLAASVPRAARGYRRPWRLSRSGRPVRPGRPVRSGRAAPRCLGSTGRSMPHAAAASLGMLCGLLGWRSEYGLAHAPRCIATPTGGPLPSLRSRRLSGWLRPSAPTVAPGSAAANSKLPCVPANRGASRWRSCSASHGLGLPPAPPVLRPDVAGG